ncbi:Interleukin-20 receptor subunit alpha [Collichthys lucidus]|uniref:Interleukin-20 receptor subunit alpha n=1 Tax=Collichthys lucidus TaxID=240159 RepID=A0A4U5VCY3_COLLU|nr:Interleukin-20 receptor subunit alpha [Collichthys lucidus]
MNRLLLGAVLLENLSVTVQVPMMLAPPTNVRFNSLDYKNILVWTPPTNSTTLQYYVQWKIYGEAQWLDVKGCQGIHRHHCDLSAVTSDTREWYYARVHASSLPASKSNWALSPRFSPRWDTVISPPVLRLNVTEEGIVEVYKLDCCSNKLPLKELNQKAVYCLQAQTVILLQAKSSAQATSIRENMLRACIFVRLLSVLHTDQLDSIVIRVKGNLLAVTKDYQMRSQVSAVAEQSPEATNILRHHDDPECLDSSFNSPSLPRRLQP